MLRFILTNSVANLEERANRYVQHVFFFFLFFSFFFLFIYVRCEL